MRCDAIPLISTLAECFHLNIYSLIKIQYKCEGNKKPARYKKHIVCITNEDDEELLGKQKIKNWKGSSQFITKMCFKCKSNFLKYINSFSSSKCIFRFINTTSIHQENLFYMCVVEEFKSYVDDNSPNNVQRHSVIKEALAARYT